MPCHSEHFQPAQKRLHKNKPLPGDKNKPLPGDSGTEDAAQGHIMVITPASTVTQTNTVTPARLMVIKTVTAY
jgi:hypothetical protein